MNNWTVKQWALWSALAASLILMIVLWTRYVGVLGGGLALVLSVGVIPVYLMWGDVWAGRYAAALVALLLLGMVYVALGPVLAAFGGAGVSAGGRRFDGALFKVLRGAAAVEGVELKAADDKYTADLKRANGVAAGGRKQFEKTRAEIPTLSDKDLKGAILRGADDSRGDS